MGSIECYDSNTVTCNVYLNNCAIIFTLPPHCLYTCAIDLCPGTSPPKGSWYSLFAHEREAMDQYVKDSLVVGIISPTSHPCIDYQGLNDSTTKNRYTLSPLFIAFEGVTVFSNLYLGNVYPLVRIWEGDEWKTCFNTHKGHNEYLVMPFMLTNAPAVVHALVKTCLETCSISLCSYDWMKSLFFP